MSTHEAIAIIDFGSQYTQLIARRIREANVLSEIYPHTLDISSLHNYNLKGIILSGGPMSIYDDGAPQLNSQLLEMNVPVLGICYGLQLISSSYNGVVEQAKVREYGKAELQLVSNGSLFRDIKKVSTVWMSHGDYITKVPEGFNIIGKSKHSPICAIANESDKVYGVQFHPEVAHTDEGSKIINNFLFNVCECKADWSPKNFIDEQITKIKNQIGHNKVLCALSGGVDSTVAAVLVKKAIGDNLICIHIDNGLMRKNESEKIEKLFKEKLDLSHIRINAANRFLTELKSVSDPEQKRKIIGKIFIDIFEEESQKIDNVKFLVQGTLYPDVIESISVKGASVTIKSHHNVGGLPKKMNLELIEPFRELFKDEVRKVGRELNIPNDFIKRHPFPGPGLAVRVLGGITKLKLEVLREADDIFISSIKEANLYDELWQAFTVLLPVSTVGVMGDSRTYEYVLSLRAVTSVDGMTADWYQFDHEFLSDVSNKIINRVRGINRVVYDISSKPPATIEWE